MLLFFSRKVYYNVFLGKKTQTTMVLVTCTITEAFFFFFPSLDRDFEPNSLYEFFDRELAFDD